MAALNVNQYLTQGAIEGFTDLIAPLTAFSYVVKPGPAALNDVVRVPYISNATASVAFTYAAGYATATNDVAGRPVTMDTILYQRVTLTDSDLVQLNPEAIVSLGRGCGARLAVDFISASLASVVSTTNFPSSASYTPGYGVYGSSLSSSAVLAALDYFANDNKWPEGNRSMILGSTAWQALLNNSTLNNASSFGTVEAVQNGMFTNVFGFKAYKWTGRMPPSAAVGATGFICHPDAVLIANGYHAPVDAGTAYTATQQVVDEKTGLTIGFRQYYDPLKASNVRIFDVLGGAAASGISTALSFIK